MKKKIAITIIGLTVLFSVVACSSKDSLTEPTETSSIVEDSKTIDTEVVATESVELTEVQESETEVSDEVAEIIKALEEQGYNLTAEDIQDIMAGGLDPTDTGVIEEYEIEKFGAELPGEGTPGQKLMDWAKSQGADNMWGWTLIYTHGEGAGDQPTYGKYVKPGSSRYGEIFHVGDYLPCNTQLTGTMEEFMAWQAQDLMDTVMENGVEGEDYEIEDDGDFVIIID